jgi:hypothetical protein
LQGQVSDTGSYENFKSVVSEFELLTLSELWSQEVNVAIKKIKNNFFMIKRFKN